MSMSYKTEYKRVAGLGSARSGVHHFISQRMTAMALVFVIPVFLYQFIGALGGDYQQVLATYQHPFPALVAVATVLMLFRHLRLGLQVVIEDYVSDHKTQLRLQIANMLTWRTLMIIGVFAIAKIAFSA